MERHRKLIRALLEYTESAATGLGSVPAPELDNYSAVQVHYHVGLCHEAGYVCVEDATNEGDDYQRFRISNLTWKGHEALSRLRYANKGKYEPFFL